MRINPIKTKTFNHPNNKSLKKTSHYQKKFIHQKNILTPILHKNKKVPKKQKKKTQSPIKSDNRNFHTLLINSHTFRVPSNKKQHIAWNLSHYFSDLADPGPALHIGPRVLVMSSKWARRSQCHRDAHGSLFYGVFNMLFVGLLLLLCLDVLRFFFRLEFPRIGKIFGCVCVWFRIEFFVDCFMIFSNARVWMFKVIFDCENCFW